MKIYIFENKQFSDFFPISTTRAVFDIRFGQSTFLERITKLFPDDSVSLIVRDSLQELVSERHPNFDVNPNNFDDGLWISGSVIWTKENIKMLTGENTAFMKNNRLVAANLSSTKASSWVAGGGPLSSNPVNVELKNIEVYQCNYLWDIIKFIGVSINDDFQELVNIDAVDYPHIKMVNPEKIFINNAKIMPGTLINAQEGPVIIDNDVNIQGQTYIQGPVYIGTETIISPLTKIKNSVIGNNCKIGGEVESSIIQGFSNKVHDGHLGDSYLGEWVNFGAGTSNSNLKNNYTTVKVRFNEKSVDTNSLHIGCFIGDHVKTAIGTLINTGTIIGPASMISTYGFPPTYIPPFSWYVDRKSDNMDFNKFVSTAREAQKRRNINFSTTQEEFYKKLQIIK